MVVHTFWPSSQLIHRSPLVRKQATACRARWWIQPSCLSWVMMASMKGKPVLACRATHAHIEWIDKQQHVMLYYSIRLSEILFFRGLWSGSQTQIEPIPLDQE